MDEKVSKAIFSLMQNVVDKLDAISKDINNKSNTDISETILNSNDVLKDLISKVLSNQSKLNQTNLDIEDRISESIAGNKIMPSTNNYTEYSLIGKEAYFKPRILVIILFSLVIIWSSIKYIPSYLSQQSLLNKEKEEYQYFYNYVYLNQFKNSGEITADKFLNRIKQKDTLLFNEYNVLMSTYQNEMRKKQLTEELRSLHKNDR